MISMVRAVDIEGLLQKYVEENSLERADALYLIYNAPSAEAAKTLRARYGRSGALSSILDDLKMLGAKIESYERAEDTNEYLRDVVESAFKHLCLDLVIESAKARVNNLSRESKEILYLISIMRPRFTKTVNIECLPILYKLLFQRELSNYEFKKFLDELRGCYFIQYEYDKYLHLPPYFDDLLNELKDILPQVEVKVSWLREGI